MDQGALMVSVVLDEPSGYRPFSCRKFSVAQCPCRVKRRKDRSEKIRFVLRSQADGTGRDRNQSRGGRPAEVSPFAPWPRDHADRLTEAALRERTRGSGRCGRRATAPRLLRRDPGELGGGAHALVIGTD